MTFSAREWLQETAEPGEWSLKTRKRLQCADGFSMSVQARELAHCSPRNDEGPWWKAEIGFPSEAESLIMEWAEDPEDPTGTVYGYVPVDIIDAVVARHGGVK